VGYLGQRRFEVTVVVEVVCACICAGERSAMSFLAVIRFKFVSKASCSEGIFERRFPIRPRDSWDPEMRQRKVRRLGSSRSVGREDGATKRGA